MAAGAGGFGDAFGIGCCCGACSRSCCCGAWYINMPAFLAFILLAIGYLILGITNIKEGRTAG